MDKALRPDRFEGSANTSTSAKEFTHWLKTFEHYVDVLPQENLDKLKLLTNYVSPAVYDYFSECDTYAKSIDALKKVYVKPSNEVFARHTLATRKQKPGETIDEFLQALLTLSKDCNFVAVSAEENRSNAIRDAFITGLQSNSIRQRLLENKSLTLDTTLDQARSLDSAQKNVECYSHNNNPSQFTVAISSHDEMFEQHPMHVNQISKDPSKCWNCGNNRHPRSNCPARDAQCNKCNRKGHFSSLCRSSNNNNNNNNRRYNNGGLSRNSDGRNSDGRNSDGRNSDGRNSDVRNDGRSVQPAMASSSIQLNVDNNRPYLASINVDSCNTSPPTTNTKTLKILHVIVSIIMSIINWSISKIPTLKLPIAATTGATPLSLRKAIKDVTINGVELSALIDSGSSHSFIHPRIVSQYSLEVIKDNESVSLADKSLADSAGHCFVDLMVSERSYPSQKLSIMNNLCVDVILGLDWQARHESLTFKFQGPEPPIEISQKETGVCGLAQMKTEPVRLFANLTPDCKPIAAKSRRYCVADRRFISDEIQSLLKAGLIEPSNSPWRAQIVVTKDPNDIHRKRMTVDYSETINKYTLLDAYPLPRIADQVNEISKYKYYSTIDLKSAYYQIPIPEKDRPLTAFEADGGLWQFKVVPNGVTNGVAVFQR